MVFIRDILIRGKRAFIRKCSNKSTKSVKFEDDDCFSDLLFGFGGQNCECDVDISDELNDAEKVHCPFRQRRR